jgi:hypothetical protein
MIQASAFQIMASLCQIPGSLDLTDDKCPNGHSPNIHPCPACEQSLSDFVLEIQALIAPH